MSKQKECRKFRALLRSGEFREQQEAKKHIAACPECRKAINSSLSNNSGTNYSGKNVEQVLDNAKPAPPRRVRFNW